MDWAKLTIDWALSGLKNNVNKVVAVPLAFSALTFLGNLALALSDGVLSEDEFHHLISIASGGETILLVIVMAILKIKK